MKEGIRSEGGLHPVLLVDDDQDFLDANAEILETAGFPTLKARTYSDALAFADKTEVRIALLDVKLGTTNGLDLLETLVGKHPRMVCVMMTAFASTESAISALKNGAYDYLRKPFFVDDLIATVNRCVEKITLEEEKTKVEATLREKLAEIDGANKRLGRIVAITQDIADHKDVSAIVRGFLEEFAKNMGATSGSLYLLEGDHLILGHSLEQGRLPETIPLPLLPGSVFDLVIKNRKPILLEDISKTPKDRRSGWDGYRNASILSVPLIDRKEKLRGVVALACKEDPPFTGQDRDIAMILASYLSQTLRATTAFEDLQKESANLASALEKLRDTQNLLQGVFDSIPLSLYVSDKENKFLMVNKVFADRYKTDAKTFEGIRISDAPIGTGKEKENLLEINRDVMSSGNKVEKEVDVGQPGGGEKKFRRLAAPYRNDRGEIVGVVGSEEDISERHQLEELLRHSQKMEAVGQLAGGIAHDFNNLLQVIQGFAQLAQDGLAEKRDIGEDIQTILRASDSASRLTSQLLAFSRRRVLDLVSLDVNEVIENLMKMLRRLLGEDIELQVVRGENCWPLWRIGECWSRC